MTRQSITFWDKLVEHRYLISFVTLLFIIGTFLYLMVADKVYRSDTTIEILPKNNLLDEIKTNPAQNSSYERYFQTQMEFLKSRYMVQKVVSKLNSNVKIYKKGILKSYKYLEEKPSISIKEFNIKDRSFYNKFFKIKIIDDQRYSLSLVNNQLFQESFSKPLICYFDKPVHTKYMDFNIIKSEDVSDSEYYIKVIQAHKEVANSIKRLQVVRRSDKSSLMEITYDANSPYDAKRFLDKLISIYTNIITKSQNSEIKNYQVIVDEEIKKIKEKLDENEKKLLEYSEKNKVSGLNTQTNNLINKIYKDEDRLAKVEDEYENIRNILVMIKRGESYENLLTILSQIENKSLNTLVQSIIEEQKKYDTLKERYKDLHPKMQEIKNSIKTKTLLLKTNLVTLFKSIKAKREELKKSIKEQKERLTNLPSKEIGLSKLKREHDQLEKVYLGLLDKRSKLKISKRVNQDYMVKVVDSPYLPTRHIKPKGAVILLLSAILGALLGLFLALVKDFFKRRVVTPEDILQISSLPLLGSITKVDSQSLESSLFVVKKPNSTASNLMWQLRNSLEKFKRRDKALVIGVSSMIRGEGKTTIASNLAVTLASGDKKVLILSLDLRLPQIHTYFGIDNRYGITNVMYENLNINNVIKKVKGVQNLYLLPAGTAVMSPMDVVNSKFMQKLLKEVRKVFDYVVIDLAPLSVAMETPIVMKSCDISLFVLKSNYSEKSFIKSLEEITEKNGIQNPQLILNAVDKRYISLVEREENEKYIKQNKILSSAF